MKQFGEKLKRTQKVGVVCEDRLSLLLLDK